MIGANALLVYANAAELDRRNMDAQSLELKDVLLLTREACREGGIPLQDMVEIEAYANEGSAMVFLHLKELKRQSIFFTGLPELLNAVAALPEAVDGEMGFWEGYYVLTVTDLCAATILSEFGEIPSRCAQYQADRAGALILDQKGFRRLWDCLCP